MQFGLNKKFYSVFLNMILFAKTNNNLNNKKLIWLYFAYKTIELCFNCYSSCLVTNFNI